jgi:hypothetical protein
MGVQGYDAGGENAGVVDLWLCQMEGTGRRI